MKAMQFEEYGAPQVLHLVDAPEPHPGPGQIRIRVRAAGVNPVDWKIRNGTSRRAIPVELPHIPGLEAAGVVDEIGPDVEGVAVGDEVFGATATGASAEYALLHVWAAKPADMDWPEAGGLTMGVETAARALDLFGDIDGKTVLISGAAGGVGAATTQLALARGATVVGTASAGNQEYLTSLGALATEYGPGLPERVQALAPQGVDFALDVAGYGVLPDLIAITGSPDKVVTAIDPDAASYNVRFTGLEKERAYYALETVLELHAKGRFSMPVARTFHLSSLPGAHGISESGHVRGKLVVTLP